VSRSGAEAKPTWRSVPPSVRAATGELLGAPVVRAMRIWGGYSPTPTFRLRLADGQRAFFKAASPDSTPFAQIAHGREERVYLELEDLIAGWAPRLLGSFERDNWRVMLLEDLGPKSAPPWTPALARNVAWALAEFHAATADRPLPDWLPRPPVHDVMGIDPPAWVFTAEDLRSLAGLAGPRRGEASEWLRAHLPALAHAARGMADPSLRHAFVHLDVRSDNLRWHGGRLYLFDWPHVGVGPPEFDAAAFAQTVTVEGGAEPEQVMAWYGQRYPVDARALDASVAAVAGYFADHAWAAEIPALPRVRTFQRQQLRVTLTWAARRLGLPHPTWLERLPGRTQPADAAPCGASSRDLQTGL
jgi:Ser/Thr protein kinase RdoA (MazF antagonist)